MSRVRLRIPADLCGVDTGEVMQVVYHLWSPTTPDWLRVIADGLPREDPRVPSVTFMWKGAGGWSARHTTCSASRSRAIATSAGSICRPTIELPLRKDFYLADDAARSPGAGVGMDRPTRRVRSSRPARSDGSARARELGEGPR